MKASDEIPQLLRQHGWIRLKATVENCEYYRWVDGVREEIHIIFHRTGGIAAWSVWRNVRVKSPDQRAGNRQRLTQFIDSA